MKSPLLFLLPLFGLFQLNAQHETLLDDLRVLGAFGGPLVEIGAINGEIGADVGGGGALLMDNFFFGGYGLGTNYPEIELTVNERTDFYDIQFGHGGFWLGYTRDVQKLAHFYSDLKIGWGRARLEQDGDAAFSDRVFVLTPAAGIEFNVVSFFKIGFTAGYRWVNGVNVLPELDNNDFSSPVGTITFRFGGFTNDFVDDWDW